MQEQTQRLEQLGMNQQSLVDLVRELVHHRLKWTSWADA